MKRDRTPAAPRDMQALDNAQSVICSHTQDMGERFADLIERLVFRK